MGVESKSSWEESGSYIHLWPWFQTQFKPSWTNKANSTTCQIQYLFVHHVCVPHNPVHLGCLDTLFVCYFQAYLRQ